MSAKQDAMIARMRELLQERYLALRMESYAVQEDFARGGCRISCVMHDQDDTRLIVEGAGVGMIDALFSAIQSRFAQEHPSLRSIQFSQFAIQGLLSAEDGADGTTRAQAEATVGILNSEGREFIFKCRAPSISHAGVLATLAGAEYFINSERAFVRLHEIIEHYRSENRAELVQKYTAIVAEVVENTSYSAVVEEIRARMR